MARSKKCYAQLKLAWKRALYSLGHPPRCSSSSVNLGKEEYGILMSIKWFIGAEDITITTPVLTKGSQKENGTFADYYPIFQLVFKERAIKMVEIKFKKAPSLIY